MELYFKLFNVVLTVFSLLMDVRGGVIEYEEEYYVGKIHRGVADLLGDSSVSVIGTQTCMRSVAECASYCYSDVQCRTAMYMTRSGDCYLIANYTVDLKIATEGGRDGKVVELSSDGSDPTRCPIDCAHSSICLQDMNLEDDSEGGCMDIIAAKQQYSEVCGFEPYIQTREYYLDNFFVDSSTTDHEYFSVVFTKMLDWTTLRVKWRGTLRGAYGASGAGLWKIRFDGADCSNPAVIHSSASLGETDTDHHKASGIQGICHELSAGDRLISLTVSTGSGRLFAAGFATNASRLWVDEIAQDVPSGEPAVGECPTLSAFNLRQYSRHMNANQDLAATLWSIDYTKVEDNTALRINLDFVMRVIGSSADSCRMWIVYVDQEDCQPAPFGRILANLGQASTVYNEHRSVEIEGHCTGISAGSHTLTLDIDHCPTVTTTAGDAHTGKYNVNRWIVEEIRLGTTTVGSLASDTQTMYRHPQFNMVIHGYTYGDISWGTISLNEGVIWTIPSYEKLYESSGLRLTLSADGRCLVGDTADFSSCCRHYFTINGAECVNPGTIEGINYLNKASDLHRPVMIEGICEGVTVGLVNLTLNAGVCSGFSKPGECVFGWNSYASLMVSETYVNRTTVEF